jgi:uncharacterized lipoprotein
MNTTLKLFVAGLSVALVSGCSTLADARKAEGEGVKKTYQAPFKQTWDVSLTALSKLKLEVASENQQQGYILAQRGMTAFSYGENIALFLKKQNENATSVEVVSKKSMSTNIFAPDWTEDIHREIALQLRK